MRLSWYVVSSMITLLDFCVTLMYELHSGTLGCLTEEVCSGLAFSHKLAIVNLQLVEDTTQPVCCSWGTDKGDPKNSLGPFSVQ